MNLTKQSEKLAISYFKKLKGFYREWYYIHSKYVGIAALDINPKLDKEIMQICGWLHDTGKVIKDEGHQKRSTAIAEKLLKGKIAKEKLEIILDCIKNHGSSGKPKTEEGKTFQKADKLAIFYPEMRKFLRKAKVPEEKVKEIMKDHFKKVRWPRIQQMAKRLMRK
jgi:HD superfamily phosphodiesterase